VNYYFAPQISGLETCVTLVNYPPVGGPPKADTDLYAYATWPDGDVWRVFRLGQVRRGETLVCKITDVPQSLYNGEGVLLFFLYPDELPDALEELPIRPIMRSAPEWRGNIQFRSESTSVSFQGEYPDQMLLIPKGSLTR
jgi:hypothetical protein